MICIEPLFAMGFHPIVSLLSLLRSIDLSLMIMLSDPLCLERGVLPSAILFFVLLIAHVDFLLFALQHINFVNIHSQKTV